MMLKGVGVDILHIPRIIRAIERRGSIRFASRILSGQEFGEWQAIAEEDYFRSVRFLAVRWSVKEAAYKALYPFGRPTWKELTFHGLQPGKCGKKPSLEYHPTSADATDIGTLHVSVSHDGEYVFATVVVENAL